MECACCCRCKRPPPPLRGNYVFLLMWEQDTVVGVTLSVLLSRIPGVEWIYGAASGLFTWASCNVSVGDFFVFAVLNSAKQIFNCCSPFWRSPTTPLSEQTPSLLLEIWHLDFPTSLSLGLPICTQGLLHFKLPQLANQSTISSSFYFLHVCNRVIQWWKSQEVCE